MINRHTGTEMWVADDRLDEYVKAGHRLAFTVPDEKPAEVKKPKKKKKG